ncbi:uncharacterized protein C16orf46 homolog isoform 3-T6 [Hipposideros larvatus]
MDLCQKNETELENSESNEIQSTEEAELTYTCPEEKSEKDHVCCLLNISDITLEQDEKANEFVIGTGWEEAVRGWGITSPMACIWPRKKLKKAKLLQKRGVQSYKAKFKARELRPPTNTQKCLLKEAKQENRPQTLETNVFPRPLLPFLTVSRVVIPVSTHRLL